MTKSNFTRGEIGPLIQKHVALDPGKTVTQLLREIESATGFRPGRSTVERVLKSYRKSVGFNGARKIPNHVPVRTERQGATDVVEFLRSAKTIGIDNAFEILSLLRSQT